MYEWRQEAMARNLPVSVLFSWPPALAGLAYLVAYVAIDWLSYISPITPIGVTPWNPATGLSFALVLLLGRDYIPWLFIAPSSSMRSCWGCLCLRRCTCSGPRWSAWVMAPRPPS